MCVCVCTYICLFVCLLAKQLIAELRLLMPAISDFKGARVIGRGRFGEVSPNSQSFMCKFAQIHSILFANLSKFT